jgi:DUF1680 family protein
MEEGDVVEISLPMEPRFIEGQDEVTADSGRVALGAWARCLLPGGGR